ncbi:MAG: GDSL-type esterase/lipase family protein [Nanoarchaeota archaeon]
MCCAVKGILVCGDSISFGRGEMPNIGWAGRLKEYFEKQDIYHCLYNLGIPGDSSTDLLKRIDGELKARVRYVYPGDKYVILIAIGINDLRGHGSPERVQTPKEQFEKNIIKIISIAKKHSKHVVVVGLTPCDEKKTVPFETTYITNAQVNTYDQLLKDAAENEHVLFLDILSPLLKKKYPSLLYDGIHPNQKGYQEMYRIIKDFLVEEKLID